MKILVNSCLELKGKPLPLEDTFELPHLVERNKQLTSLGPVTFVGQGEMASGILVVKGTITGTYTLACSKCLADVTMSFSTELEERFNIQAKLSYSSEEEEDHEIHEVVGNEIDILPFIEDEIVMSIPFIPQCESDESCKNNLPSEGSDWSVLTEEAKENKIDPRLADLAKFFDQK